MIFRGRVRQLPNVSDVSKSWYLQITTLARKTTLFLGGRGSMEGNNPNSKKIHQKMATKTRGVRSWESNNLTLVVFLKLLWPQWHLCPLSFVTWYPVPNREKSYPPYHDFQRMAALGRLKWRSQDTIFTSHQDTSGTFHLVIWVFIKFLDIRGGSQ